MICERKNYFRICQLPRILKNFIRHPILEKNSQIERINNEENVELLERIYLYYDGYD